MEEESKKTLLEEIKSDLDDLEHQLNLGTEEIKGAFEKKKKSFSSLVKKIQENLSEYEKTGSEKIKDLKAKASDLIDTLESDFDLSYTDYSENPHTFKTVVEDFEELVKKYYNEVEDKSKAAKDKTQQELKLKIEKFKHELDIQEAQLVKLSGHNPEEWEEWKQKKLDEVKSLKNKINEKMESSKQKAGKFNEEVAEAYRHLRSAFKKLK